jgi:hypothetical protein
MARRKATELRPLMTRLPEGLRGRLEREAARNDRSMNSEIIERLQRTFEQKEEIEKIYGSEQLFHLLKMVASAMHLTGQFVGVGIQKSEWMKDPIAYAEAVKAATRVLDALRPHGEARRPAYLREGTGEKIAQLVLDKIYEGPKK